MADGGAGDTPTSPLSQNVMYGLGGDDDLTGSTGDDTINNDFIELSGFYVNLSELHASYQDDGVLNQSNTTDTKGQSVECPDITQFGTGTPEFSGGLGDTSFFPAENTGAVCLACGTTILTPRGDLPVDGLQQGNLVCTMDNGPSPFSGSANGHSPVRIWLCFRTCGRFCSNAAYWAPAVISSNPQHGVLVNRSVQKLMRAKNLASATAGVRICNGKREVSNFHLMFDRLQITFCRRGSNRKCLSGPNGNTGNQP
ncbi:MAG: Hint domain-containing protein [Leisingera sp.]